jgi:hypothetical protein
MPNRIEIKINKYSELKGYYNFVYSKYTIIYLWNLYLNFNNLNIGIYNDQLVLYKENINYRHRVFIYNFASILVNEFKEICLFLKKKFYIQLNNIDLYNKSLPLLNDAFEIFKMNFIKTYSINDNYIEFIDGIYILNEGKFLSNNKDIINITNIKIFLYFDEYFQDILDNNFLIINIKNKIINYISSIFNKEKYLNYLFTKIVSFINNKEFLYEDMYNNSNQLHIIKVIESFLNKVTKKNKYKIVLDIICPFLITFKLYCISFFLKENTFDKLVENNNNFYKLNKINTIYCPLITQFHKENFIKFIIQINNLYINN